MSGKEVPRQIAAGAHRSEKEAVKSMRDGFLIANLFFVLFIGSIALFVKPEVKDPPAQGDGGGNGKPNTIIPWSGLPKPKGKSQPVQPKEVARDEHAIPVPVEDEPVEKNDTTRVVESGTGDTTGTVKGGDSGGRDSLFAGGPGGSGTGGGGGMGLDTIPGSDEFTPYEIAPVVIIDSCPQPKYPEMARISGVMGKVVAQVYVDPLGVVRRWKIIKVDPRNLGFDEAVLEVIPKWRFKPAIQQGNPVGVWVAIPFNFKQAG